MKLNHVALTVKDLDESYEWYKRNFNFEKINEYHKDKFHFYLLKNSDIILELFNFEDKTLPLPDYRKKLMEDLYVIGTKHLCLQVEDLNNTINFLQKNKVEFATEVDTNAFGGHYIFIKDCNGILIELSD